MAAALSSEKASRSVSAALRVAERLLLRLHDELLHVDRPADRLVADRCLARMLDLIGRLAGMASCTDRTPTLRALDAALADSGHAGWALSFIGRRRVILPSSYSSLAAGLRVVRRRILDIRSGIAHAVPE